MKNSLTEYCFKMEKEIMQSLLTEKMLKLYRRNKC